MSQPIVKRLERRLDHEGRTLYFIIATSDRRRRPTFLEPENVPDFPGDSAWFEVERVKKGPWLSWRAIRRVDPPTQR